MNNATNCYYNCRTNEYEYLHFAPSDWSDYIPQDEHSQALYRLYVIGGDKPVEAAKKVLKLWVGKGKVTK